MATDTTNYLKHTNQNPIQRKLINNFNKTLVTVLEPTQPVKILDVGCGEGFTLTMLQENKIGQSYEGVDNLKDALELGKKMHPELNIHDGDIYKLPYADNSFDLLICSEVLEHLEDPKKAVAELRRVTSKYIVLSVPNEPFFIMANLMRGKYLSRFGNHPEHINHWTHPGFKTFLRQNGLKVVDSRAPFAWTLVLAQK